MKNFLNPKNKDAIKITILMDGENRILISKNSNQV